MKKAWRVDRRRETSSCFFFDEVCGDGEDEELEGKECDEISAPPVYEEVGV